jgi:hypothetical protein
VLHDRSASVLSQDDDGTSSALGLLRVVRQWAIINLHRIEVEICTIFCAFLHETESNYMIDVHNSFIKRLAKQKQNRLHAADRQKREDKVASPVLKLSSSCTHQYVRVKHVCYLSPLLASRPRSRTATGDSLPGLTAKAKSPSPLLLPFRSLIVSRRGDHAALPLAAPTSCS